MGIIRGTFDDDGTPWLEAVVETAGGQSGNVRFLVSTGSARTVIHRQDAVVLDLWNSAEQQTVSMVLGEGPDTIRMDHPVMVNRIDPGPSRIGWDILGQWISTFDFTNRVLEFRGAGEAEDVTEQQERFDQLAERWLRETGGHSNPRLIVDNDAFREMAVMGEAALPLIFQKMEDGVNGPWWLLLEGITRTTLTQGVTPIEGVPGWVRTDVDVLKAAWLKWGRERGYLA